MNAIVLAAALLAAPATPEQAVATLWRALSHDAGRPGNEAELRAILHPDAMVYGARYRDGVPALSVTRGTDFAASIGRVGEQGFHECEVAREVRQYDRFATVYSVVESRNERNAPKANFTGVNSIQLYRADEGWRIIALYYQVEKPGMPVPLQGGKSGVCLEGQ
ncbi:hypothetical protein [Pseudoduganella sp. OTU4001]|uniref:hypothetical protein n=1 Tax=Pseudoduganella sp. OTU4001 TaxID=3043854 RepID=UPI00313D87DF